MCVCVYNENWSKKQVYTNVAKEPNLKRLKRGMRGMRDMLGRQKHGHLLGESGYHGDRSD